MQAFQSKAKVTLCRIVPRYNFALQARLEETYGAILNKDTPFYAHTSRLLTLLKFVLKAILSRSESYASLLNEAQLRQTQHKQPWLCGIVRESHHANDDLMRS